MEWLGVPCPHEKHFSTQIMCIGLRLGNDDLNHYLCCSWYWQFVRKARPQGLGLEYVSRGKDAALLLDKTLNDDDAIRMAAGLYALYRTVNHLRFSNTHANFRFTMKLLGKFSRRALEHHASIKLLNFDASLDA